MANLNDKRGSRKCRRIKITDERVFNLSDEWNRKRKYQERMERINDIIKMKGDKRNKREPLRE